MAEFTVVLGRNAEQPADADRANHLGQRPSQPSEVEGQVYIAVSSCWSCFAVNQLAAPDVTSFAYFFCWNCGAYNETSAIG